jgi:hypothetical protein
MHRVTLREASHPHVVVGSFVGVAHGGIRRTNISLPPNFPPAVAFLYFVKFRSSDPTIDTKCSVGLRHVNVRLHDIQLPSASGAAFRAYLQTSDSC